MRSGLRPPGIIALTVLSTISRGLARLTAATARLGRDRRGNVAVIFALCLPALVMVVLGGMDVQRITTVRSNLQDALDAATLAAARSPHVEERELTAVGLNVLRANLRGYPGVSFDDEDISFSLDENQTVIADVTVQVRTLVANVFLPPYGQILDETLSVSAHSEVNRSSKDIEVALVLDITGSMAGSRLTSLKEAARKLAAIVVQEEQQPYYSRLAVVPYSTGVNLGDDLAGLARGAPEGSTVITNAAWTTGTARAISQISRGNPGYVTSHNHGFKNGDYVWISDVRGMTQVNDRAYRVANVSSSAFSLETANGSGWSRLSTSGYSNYSRDGVIRKCLVSNCSVVVTSPGHGLSAQDSATGGPATVYIDGVSGMFQINGRGFEIAHVTTDSFSIGVNGAAYGSYSSGGRVWCGQDGCQWRVYRNTSNALRAYEISTCATERTGSAAYLDTAPSSSPVGRQYPDPSGDNPCPTAKMLPLSDDLEGIEDIIGDPSRPTVGLQAKGYTAAQIGLAWGWYAVSPNFNALWQERPAAQYDANRTMKAVILMTDGEFNAPYCSGVLARNASYGGSDRIRCDATNGEPYAQARQLCSAIKAKDIVLYTVGFQVSADSTAGRFLRDCASTPDQYFLARSGADLEKSFADIGRDIMRLRISR